jgi:hypothetical protein
VTRTHWSLGVIAMVATLCATSTLAADAPDARIPVEKDLTAVIALQGLPCGKVVSARQQGDSDYIASCDDGHRYRVYMNADGRVIAEKQ